VTDMHPETFVRKRPGRPPKEVRMKEFPVHFYMQSQEALDRLKKAAEAEGMSLSTWARTLLLREARRVLEEE
jgi:prolyl-tRNA editing enzyme YbaK/EbsC (Cys-tRNA(Pro) deacylase)